MKAAFLSGLLIFGLSAPSFAATGFAQIEVRTIPIADFLPGTAQTQFGSLEFRGGLEVLSRNADFSGVSGIDFAPDGSLYAITDTGFWFTARLEETGGRPTGLAGAKIAPMLGENGQPAPSKVKGDSEGLRIVERGNALVALVSFEQTIAVREFAGPDFGRAKPTAVKLPTFVKGIRRNQGLEAIAVAPAGSLLAGAIVAIAERSLDGKGNHRGFVLSGPQAGGFSIRRIGDFDVTDAAFVPNGDLLLLERSFSFSGGFAMRIRLIAGSAIRPGATADGIVLIDADSRYQVDNMEGIAVRSVNGETIVALVSDDNGNMLQRTVLLQFALTDATAGATPAVLPPLPRPRPAP